MMESGTPTCRRQDARRGRFRPPILKVSENKENHFPPAESSTRVLRSRKRRGCVEGGPSKIHKSSSEGACYSQKPEVPVCLPLSLFNGYPSTPPRLSKDKLSTSSCSARGGSSSPPFSVDSSGSDSLPIPPQATSSVFPSTVFQCSEIRSSVPNLSPDGDFDSGNHRSQSGSSSASSILQLSSSSKRLDVSTDGSDSHSAKHRSQSGSSSASTILLLASTSKRLDLSTDGSDSDSAKHQSQSGRSKLSTTPLNIDRPSRSRVRRISSESNSTHEHPSRSGRGSVSNSNELRQGSCTMSHPLTERDSPQHQVQPDVPTNSRKKVRVRQGTSKTRLERKLARNKGEQYTTTSGKVIPKKEAKPLRICRNKCFEKIDSETASELCDSIWKNLGDANSRRAYISGQINIVPKKVERVNASESKHKRVYTFVYYACVNGSNVIVCKGCFMSIYQVTSKFIEIAVGSKLNNPGGVQRKDKRGASSNTLANDKIQEVLQHINSFPKYKSHYGRGLTDKEFLPSTLSLKIMFDEYCKNVVEPVSRWIYEREFHKLGLKIKPLKIDTCHTCDTLAMAVKYLDDSSEKEEKLLEQAGHHEKAETAIRKKREDKAKARSEKSVETIAFDLQQCLPTPNLSSSIIFYLRQLWVYNLTIHRMSNGTSIHNMWHEAEAGRGANQISSALHRFIMNLSDETEHLILWSDTCGGQNKNAVVNCALIAALSQKKTLKTIDQKFLVSGHTHLECDSDHAIIEGKKKTAPEIHIPRDWYNLVRGASKKFSVQLLSQDQQYDFKSLHTGRGSPLVKRKMTTAKQKFVWKDVVWVQHRRDLSKGVIAFKTSHNEEEEFSFLDMRRRKKGDITLPLKNAYDGPNKISAKKKKDLLSMLHLVDPDCHHFYSSLVTDDSIPEDCDPDLLPDSEIEDSEEEE